MEMYETIGTLCDENHKCSLIRNENFYFSDECIKAEDIIIDGNFKLIHEDMNCGVYTSYQDGYITIIQDIGSNYTEEYIILHTPEQLQTLKEEKEKKEEKIKNIFDLLEKEGFSCEKRQELIDNYGCYEKRYVFVFKKFVQKSNKTLYSVCSQIEEYDNLFGCVCSSISKDGVYIWFEITKEGLLSL